jgi:Flp pilus assembly protein TadG
MLKDRGGNFAMTTALLLPITIGVGGMAVDLTNVMQEKSNLQSVGDAATLAAASKMSQDDISANEAKSVVEDYLLGQYLAQLRQSGATEQEIDLARAELLENTSVEATVTSTGGSGKAFDVKMTTTHSVPLNPLTRLIGPASIPVTISSVAASAREGNALSMYLVLDRSGSMAWDTTTVNPVNPTKTESYDEWGTCYDWRGRAYGCYVQKTRAVPNYVTKIDALKAAATMMFGELQKASAPDTSSATLREQEAKKLIRIGAVSYTHETQDEQKAAWGTTAAAKYVSDLPTVPTGGTDASGALAVGFADLISTNTTEATQHKAKGNIAFARFMVLMTDGEMTGNSSSWNRGIDDKVRTACANAKKDNITIFAVAFMAPDKGKDLLKACATNIDNYYESNDMAALVTAFGDIGRKAAKTATRLTN